MKTIKVLLCLVASFSFQASHASQASRAKYHPSSTDNFQAAVQNEATAEQIDALMQPPDINKPLAESYGQTALMVLARQKKIDCLERLLKYRPNLDVQDPHGFTAIHCAISVQGWDCYKALVRAGANVNIKTKQGTFALAMLIRNAAHIVAQDSTQLALACIKNHKTDLDLQEDDDGNSALMLASERGSLKIVKALIKRGADLFLRNKDSKTAYDLSKEKEEASKQKHETLQLELYQGISEELNNARQDCTQALYYWSVRMKDAYSGMPDQEEIEKKLLGIVFDYLGITDHGSKATAAAPASKK